MRPLILCENLCFSLISEIIANPASIGLIDIIQIKINVVCTLSLEELNDNKALNIISIGDTKKACLYKKSMFL